MYKHADMFHFILGCIFLENRMCNNHPCNCLVKNTFLEIWFCMLAFRCIWKQPGTNWPRLLGEPWHGSSIVCILKNIYQMLGGLEFLIILLGPIINL